MEPAPAEATLEAINSQLPALPVKGTLEATISQAKQTFKSATKDIPPDLPPAEALSKLQEQLQAAGLWTDVACNMVASRGDLELLQWLISTSPACPLKPIGCAISAAEYQQTPILDWLRMQYPADFASDLACSCAAAWGNLDALKVFRAMRPPLPWSADTTFGAAGFACQNILDFLCSETPPCPWNAQATEVAAARGNLEILQFLIAKGCPCGAGTLSSAVQHGQYQVADWLLDYSNNPEPDVCCIWRAAMHNADLRMLDFLADRDLFKVLPRSELCIPVNVGDLAIVKHMIRYYIKMKWMAIVLCTAINSPTIPGQMKHPLHLKHWEARRMREPDAGPQHDEVLQLVYAEMPKLDNPSEIKYLCLMSMYGLHSFRLVELASTCGSGKEPKVMWDAKMHSRAAVHGDLALLRWMVDIPVHQSYKAFDLSGACCSNARMLLLVHCHGWRVPMFFQNRFAEAEARHWAFYGVVRRLRNAEPSEETNLGKLPDALIKKIACAADIDFSWSFSE